MRNYTAESVQYSMCSNTAGNYELITVLYYNLRGTAFLPQNVYVEVATKTLHMYALKTAECTKKRTVV
jgi:hypothetical protein